MFILLCVQSIFRGRIYHSGVYSLTHSRLEQNQEHKKSYGYLAYNRTLLSTASFQENDEQLQKLLQVELHEHDSLFQDMIQARKELC